MRIFAPDGGLGRLGPAYIEGARWHYDTESAKRAEVIRAAGDDCQETRIRHSKPPINGEIENDGLITVARREPAQVGAAA